MSSNTDTDDAPSAIELKQMDAAEARQLSDAEFDKWATINDLEKDLAEKHRRAADAEQTAIDLAVGANLSELHEEIEAYGNVITFHLDASDEVAKISDRLDADLSVDSLDGADSDTLKDAKNVLVDLFAETWISFEDPAGNVEDIASYPDEAVQQFARRCIDQWGLRPSFLLLGRMMAKIREHDAEVTEAAKSFPAEESGDDPPATRTHKSWERR